jgi:hypothetical protein
MFGVITPEITELINRETNWHAQKLLQNTPRLKAGYRFNHCTDMNRDEIRKFCICLFTKNQITRVIFPGGKYWKHLFFLELFIERRFHLLLKFLHLMIMKVMMKPPLVPKHCTN